MSLIKGGMLLAGKPQWQPLRFRILVKLPARPVQLNRLLPRLLHSFPHQSRGKLLVFGRTNRVSLGLQAGACIRDIRRLLQLPDNRFRATFTHPLNDNRGLDQFRCHETVTSRCHKSLSLQRVTANTSRPMNDSSQTPFGSSTYLQEDTLSCASHGKPEPLPHRGFDSSASFSPCPSWMTSSWQWLVPTVHSRSKHRPVNTVLTTR